MSFIVGILMFGLVINCLLLILLVLIQLPKKDAGAGMAFGAGTADALFGAGSGNALTKITKYATGVFLLLALGTGYLQEKLHHRGSTGGADFIKAVDLQQQSSSAAKPAVVPAAPKPATTLLSAPAVTNAEK
jgi:protein translocase SecG subunit